MDSAEQQPPRDYRADASAVRAVSRPNLRDIVRRWTNSIRALYFSRDAAAVAELLNSSSPEMGNLQSDGKKKGKKSRQAAASVGAATGSVDEPRDDRVREKLSRSLNDLEDEKTVRVAFEKVQTPAKRHAPSPPKIQTPQSIVEPSKVQQAQEPRDAIEKIAVANDLVVADARENHREPEKSVEASPEPETPPRTEAPRNTPGLPVSTSRCSSPITDSPRVPALGILPYPTTGPPLLVTDSWRRANTSVIAAEVPTPTSQESSSDSVFTDPEDMVAEQRNRDDLSSSPRPRASSSARNKNVKISNKNGTKCGSDVSPSSHFIVSRHRKIELSPASTRVVPTSANLHPSSASLQRRYSATENSAIDSKVLRRVASFTLDRATHDLRIASPRSKFSVQKLDYKLREKFEGQHLVNWLASGLPEKVRNQLTDVDINNISSSFSAHLLSAGVLQPLDDRQNARSIVFAPEKTYCWSYQDSAATCKVTTARQTEESADSTNHIKSLEYEIASLREVVASLQQIIRDNDKRKENKETQSSPCESSNLRLKTPSASSPKSRLEENSSSSSRDQGSFSESGRFTASLSPIQSERLSASEVSRNASAASTNLPLSSEMDKDPKNPTVSFGKIEDGGSVEPEERIGSIELQDTALKIGGDSVEPKEVLGVHTGSAKSEGKTETNGHGERSDDEDARKKLEFVVEDDESCEKRRPNGEGVSDDSGSNLAEEVSPAVVGNGISPTASPPMPEVESSCGPTLPPMCRSSLEFSTTRVGIPPPPPMDGMGISSPPPPMAGMGIPPPPPMTGMGIPPPPPMAGMGIPPPPPMAGMGIPPPPPMAGMEIPPPPPMAGMGIPHPPPPMGGMGIPPPPPMAGMGIPPPPPMMGSGGPPPPPPMFGMGIPPPPPMMGSGGPPPPPPMMGSGGPPPPPPMSGISAISSLPAPPTGGWNPPARAVMRKPPLSLDVPMKPLYWTRILIPPESPPETPLWAEIEEECNLNLPEFIDLFSRQVAERKPTIKKAESEKPSKIQPVKILDSKRSRNVGILEKSLRVDFSEVENAVFTLDTSIVSLEALQQIYEVMPTSKELDEIAAHERDNPDVPLDRPELFLKELSTIQHFTERIACLMFQAEYNDAISTVATKLTNLRSTCDYLRNAQSLKRVMSVILTLGNYMNGGNRMRGQADGFGLEILGKLKDVKSKTPGVTLLHFVVRVRLHQEGDCGLDEELPLPVPEPADIEAASTINFEEISKELDRLDRELQNCMEKSEIVTSADPESSKPFQEKMNAFLKRSASELASERENFQEARAKFKAVMQFYQFVPKGATLDTADPKDFFLLWLGFCRDFKDIWKKEQQKQRKERLERLRIRLQMSRSKVVKIKKVPGGLKDRMQKLAANTKWYNNNKK